jgi:hypothetical protein
MRSSRGVRARVRFLTQDSGTRQRAASSAESISSMLLFPPLCGFDWTLAVLSLILLVI